jgi:hypothetical protein
MSCRRVDGLSVKPGPTESGVKRTVGGVILPPVNYLVLGVLALLILGVGFFLFRKRSAVIRFVTPMLLRLIRI